jgi:hypothetical protein
MKMVISTEKPKQIAILNIRDDIKKGKTLVKFAFRYAIELVTMDCKNDEGEMVQDFVWQYEEYIAEQEFDLFLKDAIPNILASLYKEIVPKLEAMQSYIEIELPREFDIEGDE